MSAAEKPWENEPDFLEYGLDGFTCLIRRQLPMKYLCGYVGVPESHPLFGKDYDRVNVVDVDVHGGLTFSSPMDGYPGLWFFGFDCAHAFDYVPGFFPLIYPTPLEQYRTIEYVQNEIEKLVRQLKEKP